MKKLLLEDLLQYFDGDELIQIVTNGHDWDEAYELYKGSDLVKPFRGYIVLDMRCEESYRDKSPVLRVLIEKGDSYDRLERMGESGVDPCNQDICRSGTCLHRHGCDCPWGCKLAGCPVGRSFRFRDRHPAGVDGSARGQQAAA